MKRIFSWTSLWTILEITDSRFTKLPEKYHVRAGARIMYDRLYGMLSKNAVLTSDVADAKSCDHEWESVAAVKCEHCGLIIED